MKYIDPFENEKWNKLTSEQKPHFKWINITGVGKRRKTLTLLELREHLRTAYFDFEGGTGVYGTKIFRPQTYAEFTESFKNVCAEKKSLKLDLVVFDPFDGLVDYAFQHLMKEHNVEDLRDIKIPGTGNGWNLLYRNVRNIMASAFQIAPLVITVTHLKLSTISKNELKQISLADFNLVGQMKSFVNDQADAHLLFEKGISKDNKPIITVNTGSEHDYIQTTFGSRAGALVEIFDVRNTDDFKTFILKQYDIKQNCKKGSEK